MRPPQRLVAPAGAAQRARSGGVPGDTPQWENQEFPCDSDKVPSEGLHASFAFLQQDNREASAAV